MEIDNSNIPKWIGMGLAVVAFGGTIFRAIFNVQTRGESNEKSIESLEETMDKFKSEFDNKCEFVRGQLSGVMTIDEHAKACKRNNDTLCAEMKYLRLELTKTNRTVEGNRNFTADKFSEISVFMGGITERNKMIDAERAKRPVRETDP